MSVNRKPRVLLADDHQIVLEGLHRLLAGEFEICGEAANGQQMVEMAREQSPDLIVADISMPLLNGIEALRKLREENIPAKVVLLTMHPDATYLTRALEAGASAYVLKHTASEELAPALREALRGRIFISEQLRGPSIDALLDPNRRHVRQTIELTPRQREVLQLLAEGKSAKEIGGILGISARTVESHKYKMMDDLGVKTTAQLVQHALRHSLTPPVSDP